MASTKASSGRPTNGPKADAPALLTRMSMPPSRSAACAITPYGEGLGAWTRDGGPMLGALAALTRRARIGPAVTYAFDPSSHHPAWLAKRAVAVDHLSRGRLDLRLAVGAEDAAAARSWA